MFLVGFSIVMFAFGVYLLAATPNGWRRYFMQFTVTLLWVVMPIICNLINAYYHWELPEIPVVPIAYLTPLILYYQIATAENLKRRSNSREKNGVGPP